MKNKWLIRSAVVLGACMAAVLIAAPVMAAWSWCSVDPVYSINGHTLRLQAEIQGDPEDVRGHVTFRVEVPKGTDISLVSLDPEWKAKSEIHYVNDRDGKKDEHDKDNEDVTPGTIPVKVTYDLKTTEDYPCVLIVTLDNQEIARVDGTTKGHGEGDFAFVIS
jgi:hypothetical protein